MVDLRNDDGWIDGCNQARAGIRGDLLKIGIARAGAHRRRARTLAGGVLNLGVDEQNIPHVNNAEYQQQQERQHQRKFNHALRTYPQALIQKGHHAFLAQFEPLST
jgi:hypothetical protein